MILDYSTQIIILLSLYGVQSQFAGLKINPANLQFPGNIKDRSSPAKAVNDPFGSVQDDYDHPNEETEKNKIIQSPLASPNVQRVQLETEDIHSLPRGSPGPPRLFNPQNDNSVNPQYANSIDPQYANSANSIDPQYANSVNPQYANSIDPQYANSVNPQYANSIDPQYANSFNHQYNSNPEQYVNYADTLGPDYPEYGDSFLDIPHTLNINQQPYHQSIQRVQTPQIHQIPIVQRAQPQINEISQPIVQQPTPQVFPQTNSFRRSKADWTTGLEAYKVSRHTMRNFRRKMRAIQQANQRSAILSQASSGGPFRIGFGNGVNIGGAQNGYRFGTGVGLNIGPQGVGIGRDLDIARPIGGGRGGFGIRSGGGIGVGQRGSGVSTGGSIGVGQGGATFGVGSSIGGGYQRDSPVGGDLRSKVSENICKDGMIMCKILTSIFT